MQIVVDIDYTDASATTSVKDIIGGSGFIPFAR
jgi:hypothetical protein